MLRHGVKPLRYVETLRRGLRWLGAPALGPERYALTRSVFLLTLALGYAAAFVSLWVQVDGLLGSEGIAPAAELLERARAHLGSEAFLRVPTLLWLGSPDAALHALCAGGVAASLGLALGFAPRICAALCWVFYLSLVAPGDVFLRYQWDALLLETGLLSIWLAPAALRPAAARAARVARLPLWLLRFLLFKLMFLSGAVKLLSGDETWRALTALGYHYFTQPIPTWVSWYVHHLPDAVHRLSVVATFVAELALPLLIFAPRRGRWIACAGFVGLQLMIGGTGNYGFFNVLTLALCVLLLEDAVLLRLVPRRWRPTPSGEAEAKAVTPVGRTLRYAALSLGVLLATLNAVTVLEALRLRPPFLAAVGELRRTLAPMRAVNGYGLFAVMTTTRVEIELEGSADGEEWLPYVFDWKPGAVDRAPAIAGLHMPRLDWQMWFAALRGCERAAWFHTFLQRLLEGSESVRGLLANDPFPDAPPRFLRSSRYRYEFTQPGEPGWWKRQRLGSFCPKVRLRGGRMVSAGR